MGCMYFLQETTRKLRFKCISIVVCMLSARGSAHTMLCQTEWRYSEVPRKKHYSFSIVQYIPMHELWIFFFTHSIYQGNILCLVYVSSNKCIILLEDRIYSLNHNLLWNIMKGFTLIPHSNLDRLMVLFVCQS